MKIPVWHSLAQLRAPLPKRIAARLLARNILVALGASLSLSSCLKSGTTSASSTSDASLSECSLNSATTGTCKVSTTGSIVTTTLGSNVTSWANASASTTVTATIPNGFYTGKTVTFTDSLLIASNIKYGVSIFGVTGTEPGLASNAARDPATSQLAASGESITYAGQRLPTSGGYVYREVPSVAKDDEGTNASNVTYVDRSSPVDWTGRTCGSSGTIEQRISDCEIQLGSTQATWNGATKGNAGQATWKIVTRTGNCGSTAPNRTCREVWRDSRTQLLWSSRISESINWCRASGANNIGGNPFAAADASGYCDNVANQAVAGQAVSACFDDSSTDFTNTHADITNSNAKGALAMSSTPAVAWRLPTLGDYRQAEIDGIRFVLPDMGTNISGAASTYEWTATVLSATRASAWIFDSEVGHTATTARNSASYGAGTVGARCVGR